VGAVVGDGGRSFQICSRELWRKSVELKHQQAESSNIRSPPAQVADQIVFQLVRKNFFAKVSKCATASSRTVTLHITC